MSISGHQAQAVFAPMTVWQVIRWWELRRLLYNAVLLVVGAAAIVGLEFLMEPVIPHGEDAIEPMMLAVAVPAYGFMANLCYTLGWIVELIGREADPGLARRRARWMFRAGLLFSCVLTSLPFWFALGYWLVHRGWTSNPIR